MTSQRQRAERFRDLHRGPGMLVLPNPWDAGSAKMLASLGFDALATTSAGLAFSLGRRDAEGAVSRTEALENARAIVAATDLPVAADLENGYGDAPQDCATTIRLAAEAGLVGGSIEDASGRAGQPIYEFSAALERVAAAVEAALRCHFRSPSAPARRTSCMVARISTTPCGVCAPTPMPAPMCSTRPV